MTFCAAVLRNMPTKATTAPASAPTRAPIALPTPGIIIEPIVAPASAPPPIRPIAPRVVAAIHSVARLGRGSGLRIVLYDQYSRVLLMPGCGTG
jgi:hypothetical protein